MLPRGSFPLVAMRQAGQKPAGFVWVSFGEFKEPDWNRWANTQFSPELVVLPADPVDRLDFRCLIGLRVILFLSNYNDKAALLFERLQEYASEIDVMSPDFDLDIGWHWSKKSGQRDFGTAERMVA